MLKLGLILFMASILGAYIYAIFNMTGDRVNPSTDDKKGKTRGGAVKSETVRDTANDIKDADSHGAYDWRENLGGGPTPEGQARFRKEQTHVPKDLSDLIPKLQYLKDKHHVDERGKRSKYNLFKPFTEKNRVQLGVKRDKKGEIVYVPVTSVKKEDLQGMGFYQTDIDAVANITYNEAVKGRERLVDILHEAGIEEIDPEAIALLPKWSDVQSLYGDKPVILGLERCEEFRSQADPIDASIGIAGMFNTGTNPMAMYVSNNCKMPNNKKDRAGGTRWQVPWGKHRLASEKYTNIPKHEKRTNMTNVLPVVLVRDPYSWMQSMCKHKYESRWPHGDNNCPNLAERKLNDDGTPKKVEMMLKYKPPIYFDSLADYWGRWYKEYLESDFPRLIVRFEDIHFHARELIETICQCAGAVPREEDSLFRYVVSSAKWGAAHKSSTTNMISAMVKYGSEKNRFKGMKDTDWMVAKEIYTPEIMELFGYKMPEHLIEKAQ